MGRHEPRLSREEIAKREIGRTEISPALAWVMVAVFLTTIIAVPTTQSIQEIAHKGTTTRDSRWPGWCGIASTFDGVTKSYRNTKGSRFTRVVAANARLLKNLHDFEGRLEDESFLTRRLLAPTQYWLTRAGGLGNEKAYVGLDRWLFYRPGVDYVTGPGFLEPAVIARRASGGNEYTPAPQPDPRPAILQFQDRLARSGVRLILMPTPDKAMIEPERLSSRYRNLPNVLHNPSFERFNSEMEAEGVLVFDPAPLLRERKEKLDRAQFLTTDTHWTPDAMETVAKQLSAYIATHSELPARPATGYGSRSTNVRNLGDVAVMMRLPSDQKLFSEQSVTIRQVLQPDGSPWRPDRSADVLLLGDSFTNIYSMPEMHWGESAGFAEQLSLAMKRPIDRIAQNDAGANATRQALALELARGERRLDGLRVVVWQFAIRELAVGDWKLIPFPESIPAETSPQPKQSPPDSSIMVARGQIRAVAGVPQPGSVPYRDAITAVHLGDVETLRGPALDREVVVYLWGMRDNRWTDAARYQPGQTVTLNLTPWAQAQPSFGRFTRVELDDPDFTLIDLPTYWAGEAP
jgi:alginate O-acetyltransferase complex protein AlgJ